jgi:hypothetical protein
MFANRRPSLVMRVHMFRPTHGRNWYPHHVVRDLQGRSSEHRAITAVGKKPVSVERRGLISPVACG